MSPVPTLSPLLPSPCQSSRAENFLEKNLAIISRACYIEKGLKKAEIAQLVEQRTENPRVRGSNPRLGIGKTLNTDQVFEYTAKCEDAKNETKLN